MANPYLQVLRTPHTLPMVAAAFIGRLPLSMVGLGSVLLIASETGSYGLGGAVAAVGAVTTALAGPVLGRLADRHGQRRVLLPVLAVFVPSGVTFLVAVRQDWPLLIVFASAGLAGACIPPVSSMIRVRWTHRRRRHRASSATAPGRCACAGCGCCSWWGPPSGPSSAPWRSRSSPSPTRWAPSPWPAS